MGNRIDGGHARAPCRDESRCLGESKPRAVPPRCSRLASSDNGRVDPWLGACAGHFLSRASGVTVSWPNETVPSVARIAASS
jgi:hypothetical protein